MTTRPTPQAPDDEIRRAWQDVSNEQPPAHVDAAILAAARRAAGEAPSSVVRAEDRPRTRRWFQRWQPVLAAAGVTGLAFVLLQSLPRDSERAMLPSVSAPARQSKSTAEAVSEAPEASAAPATEPAAAPADRIAPERPPMTVSPPPMRAAPAREADSPAPAAAIIGDAASTDQAAAEPPMAEIAPAPAAAKKRAEAGGRMLGTLSGAPASVAAESVAATVARIEDLYRRGDRESAADALRQLRATTDEADELLPEPLKAWARTVE